MADTSLSNPFDRGQPRVRRSVTLPLNLGASKSSPGTPPAPTPDGAETLFTYHTSKIISFSPPLTRGLLTESRPRKDSPDDEPVGVLPWGSHTERTLSTGSLRLYKVPGSTTFLQSGRTIHAIMSKSRCWCVDGESKFVLRIRGNNYYRIELPNSTTEDQDAVAEFKVVLDRILQYETTQCPFKRGFYIELPERPDIILKPWKPKHSPITARQAEDEPAQLDEGPPLKEVDSPLHVEKRTADQPQRSLLSESLIRESDGEENVTIEDVADENHSTAYVGTLVSNYETMKQLQMQRADHVTSGERQATVPLDEDTVVPNVDHESAANDVSSTFPVLHSKESSRSTSQGVEKTTSSRPGSLSSSDGETDVEHRHSILDEHVGLPAAHEVKENLLEPADIDVDREVDLQSIEGTRIELRHEPRRSFTAPVRFQPSTLSSASISSSEQEDEITAEGPASSNSSTRSAGLEKQSIPPTIVETGEGPAPDSSDSEPTEEVSSDEEKSSVEETKPSTSSLSDPGSSTPEWLDLSAPSTPQTHPQPGMDEDERRDPIRALSLDGVEASPRSQLRRRFQQRREISPMPSLSVLHVPSRENPALDVAVVLFRSVCRTLLALSLQIVLLLMSLASRLLGPKTGAGTVASSERNYGEDGISEQWDSDSTADEFASVTSDIVSEDDFGVPIEGKKVEKRRASSGVKSRRKVMRPRESSAHSSDIM